MTAPATATSSAVRALARAHAASRTDDVLSARELCAAARLAASVPSLNYDAYCMVRDALPAKASKLLTASLFARVRFWGAPAPAGFRLAAAPADSRTRTRTRPHPTAPRSCPAARTTWPPPSPSSATSAR